MKNPLHNPKPLILLATGLVGLGVFVLWPGETTDTTGEPTRPASRAASAQGSQNRTEAPGHRPAHRRNNHGQTASGDGANPPPATDPAQPSATSRPRNADGTIIRRAAGNSHSTGKTTGHGPNLRSILATGGLRARQRVAALESLRSSGALTDENLAAAEDYLTNATPPEGTTPGQHHWIIDELITTMRANGADNAALSRTLASVYQNRNQDIVVRDYALQHLGHLQSEGGDPRIINSTLQAATTEKQGTLAGTALLALNQGKEDTGVGDKALKVATDTAMDLRSRITAMQVAGKQGNTGALPMVATAAADTTQPVALRMAAIATLADLNAKDQQPLLTNLSQSGDTRLRSAAKAALTKLSKENQLNN